MKNRFNKLLKKGALILPAICFAHTILAQMPAVDSLKRLLTLGKEDSTRIDILTEIAWTYAFNQPDTAIIFVQEAILLAKSNKFLKGREADAIGQYGYIQGILGNYPDAIKYGIQSVEYLEQVKHPFTASAYLNLGETYCDNDDISNAMLYLDKTRKLIGADDKSLLIRWYSLLTKTEKKANLLDSALYHALEGIRLEIVFYGTPGKALLPLTIADIYREKKEYSKAIDYYKRTRDLTEDQNFTKDLMDVNNGLASLYRAKGQLDSCIYYAQQTLSIGKSNSYRLALLQAYTILSGVYKSKNKMDSTVRYLELTNGIKDSLFNQAKERDIQNLSFNKILNERELAQQVEETELVYKNRLNIYLLLAGLLLLVIVAGGLWRKNIYKQKSYALLEKQKHETDNQRQKAEITLEELKVTQAQLIQSEKMASLGELTAGIAHEIQNPLNFVNNFSEVNTELLGEMKAEIDKGNFSEVKLIAKDITDNEQKINLHGKRADAIVKGMLQHSKRSSGIKESTDINALADEYLRLSYYGIRAKDKNFNVTMQTDFDNSIGKINIIPQDIGKVMLNLYNNAFYAVGEKSESCELRAVSYEPKVTVSTKKLGDRIEIRVEDNGNGIPQNIVDKIFQPFFTTKPTGQGTGLGLSLAYDIVKAHGGELKVETMEGEGSEFNIQLPYNSFLNS